MNITFVHTPMAAFTVPERELFWHNFDIQYHAAHPGLRHMVNNLWELPHWMHWLGGVFSRRRIPATPDTRFLYVRDGFRPH